MLTTWGSWFFSLWPKWFWVNEEGIWAGQPFIWADWSVHITYVSRFLATPMALWFTKHPVFALEKWTYPPVPNFLSAALIALKVPFAEALLLPVVLGTAALLLLLFHWFRAHRLSERASFVGVTLFLLSGAWGWPMWLQAVSRSANAVAEIAFPSRLYTQIFENHLVWLNPIAGMVLPQRSFTIGFPLLLFLLLRIRRVLWERTVIFSFREPLLLAVFSTVLFLTHTHSFFSLAILCACWFFLFAQRWKFWLTYAGATLVLTAPWYWFILRGSGAVASYSIDLGWMSPEPFNLFSWLFFWLKNWGFTLPLALLGWWQASAKERSWYGAFFILFLFANIVRMQSYDWDNAKLLIVALVGILPAMVAGLQFIRQKLPPLVGAFIVVLVVLLSIWGGVLEVVRVSQPDRTTWRMAGSTEIEFAEAVRRLVPPNETVLTSDLHNHPVPMLAGRPTLLGYIGWVWSYGFDYERLQQEVKLMYTDSESSPTLRQKYAIRFVVLGPHERSNFGDAIFLHSQCRRVTQVAQYQLLDCPTFLAPGE